MYSLRKTSVFGKIFIHLVIIYFYSNAKIFITAPNVFHIGVEETISVILYNTNKPVNVTVIAQDFPDKQRNLSAASGIFTRGKELSVILLVFFF